VRIYSLHHSVSRAPDNEVSAGFTARTERAARVAAAALIDATLAVVRRRYASAFVLCRPPTHHAVGNAGCCRGASPQNLPFGFCHLNGVSAAIAAVWAAAAAAEPLAPRPRVAIIDVDVHHGNANEDTWFADGDVLHVNLNEAGIWPGPAHGDPLAVGIGRGVGANLNFPMPTGEGDAAYCYAFAAHALPAIERFAPALVLVACGLDALGGDP
jgi:acetoin utilization deacetylase AcuC-like enzyme